jgi:hypothetical protein
MAGGADTVPPAHHNGHAPRGGVRRLRVLLLPELMVMPRRVLGCGGQGAAGCRAVVAAVLPLGLRRQ